MRGKGGLAPWVPCVGRRKAGLVALALSLGEDVAAIAFLIAFRTMESLEGSAAQNYDANASNKSFDAP